MRPTVLEPRPCRCGYIDPAHLPGADTCPNCDEPRPEEEVGCPYGPIEPPRIAARGQAFAPRCRPVAGSDWTFEAVRNQIRVVHALVAANAGEWIEVTYRLACPHD